MMFLINDISFGPFIRGGARRSARSSVICNTVEIFTPAAGTPQLLIATGKYSGGKPHLAPIRRCALQVDVERTTDSGFPATAVKYLASGLCRAQSRTAIKHCRNVSFVSCFHLSPETLRPAVLGAAAVFLR